MKEIKVNDYIWQYEFIEDEKNPNIVVNITVIIDEQRALIIDTAFSEHAQMLKEQLKTKGIKPEIVVLSHYHPDHVCGVKEFDGCEFVGSALYQFNLDNCKQWCPDHEFIVPTILIEETAALEFGRHRLTFMHMPGHCQCSIITIINEDIVHVGDLVMKTSDRKSMLPYIGEDGSFLDHVQSLHKILGLGCNIMLLAHGDAVMGKQHIMQEIDKRLFYLTKVHESSGKLPLEECLKGEITEYSLLRFHEKNLKHVQ
ncbi:MBL fold metallo-hydrolase [Anaerosolibacter sp.]|uniref:MBL fold metallo-hydrolase n=1 Tax=Anaerosolibacter sp. TaxID=1872527 RepID=UPI0039F13A90